MENFDSASKDETSPPSPELVASPRMSSQSSKPAPVGVPKKEEVSSGPKKFQNGWTKELEDLMAEWADKALVYRWLHERTSGLFKERDTLFFIPIVILSTLTGTANFGMGSFFGDDAQSQRYAQLGVGGFSIIAGMLTTLANYYSFSKCAETHRTSAVSWGKFNRLISIELRVNPDERIDAKAFLKMFRIELDRLVEQSPVVPDMIIEEFKILFEDSDIRLPDILGVMEHTKVFTDSGSRLKKLAAEATIAIQQKKGLLKQLVLDDLDSKIRTICTDEVSRFVGSTPTGNNYRMYDESPSFSKKYTPVNEVVVKL